MKGKQSIIFLHGWIQKQNSHLYYKEAVAGFEQLGYKVFVPDMPGFGQSAIPSRQYTLHDYAVFLKDYIENNHIQSPVLIGHSFGGRVIIKYAVTFPHEIKAIVLSGTPGFSPVKRVKLFLSLLIAKIGKFIFSIPLLSKYTENIRNRFYYFIGAKDFYRAKGTMKQTFKNIVNEPLGEAMKQISIPTLLVWGQIDRIVPFSVGLRMQEYIPGSKCIGISNAGHGVIVEKAKTFVKEVQQFLISL